MKKFNAKGILVIVFFLSIFCGAVSLDTVETATKIAATRIDVSDYNTSVRKSDVMDVAIAKEIAEFEELQNSDNAIVSFMANSKSYVWGPFSILFGFLPIYAWFCAVAEIVKRIRINRKKLAK